MIESQTISRRDDVALLVARVGLGSLFIFSGVQKIIDFQGASGFAAKFGVPFAPYLMPLAIALELIAATMLITGWRARTGAAVLAVWMFVLNPWFHQFWTFWGKNQMMWQLMIDSFFHHFVMIGGMIYVMVFGPGRLTIGASRV